VVGTGRRLRRIGVTGDICLGRPRPTQGCCADDDDDDKEIRLENVDRIHLFQERVNGWFLRMRCQNFGFCKRRGILAAGRKLAFEGLSSTDLPVYRS